VLSLSDLDEQWDAVVIGGGPAGSVSATLLARLGWRTLLIDKGPIGRSKCCGHCLNPRAIDTLDQLGLLNDVRETKIGVTQGVLVHTSHAAPLRWSFDDSPGWVTPREKLDASLQRSAAGAGAVVLNQTMAKVIAINSTGSEIAALRGRESRRLRASLVVGADGLNSAVARSAGLLRTQQIGRKYGFAATIEPESKRAHAGGWVHMFVSKEGYLGAVEDGAGRLHIAALVNRSRQRRASSPKDFVQQMQERFEPCRSLLGEGEARSILAAGPMPCRTRAVAAPGVALVGDAAGYVEPFTGEGILCAVQSAELLRNTMRETEIGCFGQDEARMLQRMWRQRIGAAQRRCRWISRGLEHPVALGGLSRIKLVGANIEGRVVRAIMSQRGRA